ncbi:MAG: DNA repair protein RecO [Bacillota bacterium]|jgi:DNA repair protein RecO (recombination protein O)
MGPYKARAIVLKSRDFQEADRVVTLLSDRHGKIEAVARGARRTRSQLGGATQPFCLVTASFYPGKTMDTMSQAEVTEGFRVLREDLELLANASYLCELVDESMGLRDATPGAYPLLLKAFGLLRDGHPPATVRHMFQLRFLGILGIGPGLDRCLGCGREVLDPFFSPGQGGVLCHTCGSGQGAGRLSRQALECMKALLRLEPGLSGRLVIDARTEREMCLALDGYILWHLDKKLKSLSFLKQLGAREEQGDRCGRSTEEER